MSMIRTALAAAILLCVAMTTPAPALSLFAKKQAPAPQFYIHDEATFAANTRPYHETPFNDRQFEFDITLPKDWTSETISVALTSIPTQDIPFDIIRYKSPMMGTMQAVVTIQYLRLAHEVTVENWLQMYAQSNSFTLQQPVTMLDGNKRATIGFLSVADLKTTYTYLVAEINGPYVIMARFDIPQALQAPLAFLQKRTIDSFRLIMPSEEPIEETKTFPLGEAVTISYPKSWNVHFPDVKNSANMSVQFHNELAKPSYFDKDSRKVEGMIRVTAIRRDPKTSLDAQMKELKKYFTTTAGIDIGKLVSSTPSNAYNRFLFSRQEIYEVKSNRIMAAETQEIRLVVLGDKEWYIILYLLTPLPKESLPAWARNTRTFELVTKNLK